MNLYQSYTFFTLCLLIVTLFWTLSQINCIKLVDIFVPDRATQGSDVELVCNFDLENDTLYALKWHYNGREFYRYAPKSNPKMQTFVVNGTNVNKAKSHQGNVVLRNVSLISSGRYSCEISAEKTFQTIFGEKIMRVSANSGQSRWRPLNTSLFRNFEVLFMILIPVVLPFHGIIYKILEISFTQTFCIS